MNQENLNQQVPPPVPPQNPGFNQQVPPHTHPEHQKKSRGCLWFFLGFGAFCLVVFGAVTILGGIIGAALSGMKEAGEKEYESYERVFIAGNREIEDTILVIPVNGVITGTEESSPFGDSGMATAGKICQHLKMARKDENVKAVIMQINTPGGEVVASDMIHHAIKKVRDAGKPVIAVIGTMGTSGGYYIACACDKIIAHRLSITGSIGVIIQNYKYYDLLNKIGVKSDTYTSCKYKDLLSGARPEKPGERKIIQDHVDKVYQAFIQIVAEGRPALTVKQLQNSTITDGRIFLGSEAFKMKLVDQLGFFEDGIELAAKLTKLKDYRVMAYKKKFTLAALFGAQASMKKDINIKIMGKDKDMIEAGKFYYLPIQ